MKKLLATVIAALLLTGCTIPPTDGDSIVLSGGVQAASLQAPTPAPITEAGRIDGMIYYYSTVRWEYCMIDGTTYEDVSFMWTDLGMALVDGDRVIYIPNIQEQVSECVGVLEIREG